jgi:urease accessory protein
MSTDKTTSINEISMLQLSDSFFPTGMYTTSNGLEALFYNKRIKNSNELRDLVQVYLEHQIGPADCAALGNSYEYAQRSDLPKVLEVDQKIFSMKLVKEIRDASSRAGTQLLKCLTFFTPNAKLLNMYLVAINKGQASGVYPVALAIASKTLNIPKNKSGLMMLYSFSVSVVGAALRLGLVQHFEGQRIIHELKPTISEVVKNNIDRPLESMWQFAPDIDITQIVHERMSSKMFIT